MKNLSILELLGIHINILYKLMDNYYLYKKYKKKYRLALGGETKTYRDWYLDALKHKNCSQLNLIEDSLKDIYHTLEHEKLTGRYLYLYDNEFRNKFRKASCGDFWQKMEINKDYLQNVVRTIDQNPDLSDDEDFKEIAFSLEISFEDIEHIEMGNFVLFKSRQINRLYCLVVNNKDDIVHLIYDSIPQSIQISNSDDSGNLIHSTYLDFNITSDLTRCRIRECHIDSFFYQGGVTDELKNDINRVISRKIDKKTKGRKPYLKKLNHWTSWLLAALLNLIFNCLNGEKIHLQDASYLKGEDKYGNCRPYTIIYQSVKGRNPMYQSLGFKADPPIDFKNVDAILNLKPPEEVIQSGEIEEKEKNRLASDRAQEELEANQSSENFSIEDIHNISTDSSQNSSLWDDQDIDFDYDDLNSSHVREQNTVDGYSRANSDNGDNSNNSNNSY